jgi:SAM-dependent methyltransferase
MAEPVSGVHIDPSNAVQARAWDGDEGAYWAAHWQRFDEAVAGYQRGYLDAAHIGPSEHILDVGCGTGQCTRDAARIARDGLALGLDLSSEMIRAAESFAVLEGLTNVQFAQADAQIYPFEPASFDVALSRMGAMFFGDPVAAFGNIARALKAGGRLCLLVWQALVANEWIRDIATTLGAGRQLPAPPPGAPGPFSLADPVRARAIIASAGFADIAIDDMHAPFCWGPAPAEAYDLVVGLAGWMMDGLDGAARTRALGALRATLDTHAGPNGVTYDSAVWLITAARS